MGDEVLRDPVPLPHIFCFPPEILPGGEKAQYLREACRDSDRNMGWQVRVVSGEVESRGSSLWNWSRVGSKRDKDRTGCLGPSPTFLSFLGSQNS